MSTLTPYAPTGVHKMRASLSDVSFNQRRATERVQYFNSLRVKNKTRRAIGLSVKDYYTNTLAPHRANVCLTYYKLIELVCNINWDAVPDKNVRATYTLLERKIPKMFDAMCAFAETSSPEGDYTPQAKKIAKMIEQLESYPRHQRVVEDEVLTLLQSDINHLPSVLRNPCKELVKSWKRTVKNDRFVFTPHEQTFLEDKLIPETVKIVNLFYHAVQAGADVGETQKIALTQVQHLQAQLQELRDKQAEDALRELRINASYLEARQGYQEEGI